MRDRFKILALSTVGMVSLLILGGTPAAAGGGGCHAGITSANAADGETASVEMIDACFTPTTLRVEPGAQVAFVNRDVGLTHNVGGNYWGHFEDMHRGDGFMATFEQPGTYPYACSYHAGMTGAVIVGDGSGAGDGELIDVQAFETPDPVVVTRTRSVAPESSSTTWIAAGALGLLIGAAGGIGLMKLRRTAAA